MDYEDTKSRPRKDRYEGSPTRPSTRKSYRSSKPNEASSTQMTRQAATYTRQPDNRIRPLDFEPQSSSEQRDMYETMKALNFDIDPNGNRYELADLDERNLATKGAPTTDPERGERKVIKPVDVMKDTPETRRARARRAEAKRLASDDEKARSGELASEQRERLRSSHISAHTKRTEAPLRRERSSHRGSQPAGTYEPHHDEHSIDGRDARRRSRPRHDRDSKTDRPPSRSAHYSNVQGRTTVREAHNSIADASRYSSTPQQPSRARGFSPSKHRPPAPDDTFYSRSPSPHRASPKHQSKRSAKRSTRRHSKSRSRSRRRGDHRRDDTQTMETSDRSLPYGTQFGPGKVKFVPPPLIPLDPYTACEFPFDTSKVSDDCGWNISLGTYPLDRN